MGFTKDWNGADEAEETAGSTGYLRYFKNPATTFRILQDPTEGWKTYWEHFNPGGFPFPCTGDRQSCPGCTSDNEKVRKASKRVAINVLEGEYVNVYKFPKTLADKLQNRAERIGTLKDRDYTVYKMQEKNTDGSLRTDYDIEGGDKEAKDLAQYELKDVEEMLQDAYDQSWGTQATETQMRVEDHTRQTRLQERIKRVKKDEASEPPPFEPKEIYTEEELRSLSSDNLVVVMKGEGIDPPENAASMSPDALVDWLLEQ